MIELCNIKRFECKAVISFVKEHKLYEYELTEEILMEIYHSGFDVAYINFLEDIINGKFSFSIDKRNYLVIDY